MAADARVVAAAAAIAALLAVVPVDPAGSSPNRHALMRIDHNEIRSTELAACDSATPVDQEKVPSVQFCRIQAC